MKLRGLINQLLLWTKQNSPELLISAGIIGAGTAVVLGCVASTKLKDITEPATKKIAELHEAEEVDKKELVKTYTVTAGKLAKLYAPTAITFAVATTCLLCSHKIVKGRELAAAAAYTALEETFRNYREKVEGKVGKEAEEQVFQEVVTAKPSEVKEEKKNKVMYEYLFDETNPNWCTNGTYNLNFLYGVENFLNDKLRVKGHIFLSEVYDALGVEPSQLNPYQAEAAKYLGWIYDTTDPTRDCYINFGLRDSSGILTPEADELRRNDNDVIFIKFNPDGDILRGEKNFLVNAKGW